MRTLDLFAGCGGLTLGFQNSGFEVLAGFDNWDASLEVYRANFNHDAIKIDLKNLNGNYKAFRAFKPDIIIGGPPCQDFSHAGKRNEALGRADLTIIFADIVSSVLPEWFVMENVDRAIHGRKFQEAIKIFKNAGYGLTVKILDASLCGAPQYRKRVFAIGHRFSPDNALAEALTQHLSHKPLTVREYFNNRITTEYYYRHPRNYSRRAIYSIDEPSPTIRGVNRPIPKNYKPRPNDAIADLSKVRPLTTQERSLIQTFPPDFVFRGTKSDVEQMIGNAVPVKLSEHVARAIASHCGIQSESVPNCDPSVQLALF